MDTTTISDIRNSKISINIAENREQFGKKFTEYIIDITNSNGHEYTIARRFSEFHSLYELLVHNYQIQFPFPPKKLNKLNVNIIEIRKKALQDFLKFLVIHPSASVRKSDDVIRFLDQNTASFNNKLIKEKLTFEQVNQKKKSVKLEVSIVEGKEFRLQKKSMWDIVSYCIFDVGHEPIDGQKSTKKTSIIAGPYPRWSYKTKVTIKSSEPQKTLYFKVFNQESTLSITPSGGSSGSGSGSSGSNNINNNINNNNSNNNNSNINNGGSGILDDNNSGSVTINTKDCKVDLIGSCSVDIDKLQITNQSPTLHVLHLEPEGSGEILISLLLL
ncbi:hypothetical protein DDB_G0285711 [Dictyostelium discoideum AX4]|uniref:PX domain-containing protein n=1 Tax=Dictyostelium discoideum TaxID=44689 RepID=Q54MR5_DICDI|nr:hypothetical protein DDB_G0285711 [Dictyostelium discoideum AX4]EAL64693.1 hypothetical protein DDB_G0285711 [Dictyostelium discoideum AX4]|eukprot:XP_638228.1 hypothetical protein DDB_G0285711 [Dictyostelium discoideum AX4]